MNRSQLVNAVKAKIDEISPLSGVVLVDVGFGDGKTIDAVIDSFLDDCVQELNIIAPIHYLNVYSINEVAVSDILDSKIGTVKLPSDYLRIVEFRMEEWERSVYEVTTPNSILGKRQNNEYLRGNVSLPVVIFENGSDGIYYKYYSVISSHVIVKNTYIKKETAENTKAILQPSIVSLCASKYFLMINKLENAKALQEESIKLLM